MNPLENRCHTEFKLVTLPGVFSEITTKVDTPRHVRDLHPTVPAEAAPTRVQTFSDDEDPTRLPARQGYDSEEEVDGTLPRRTAGRNDSQIVLNHNVV